MPRPFDSSELHLRPLIPHGVVTFVGKQWGLCPHSARLFNFPATDDGRQTAKNTRSARRGSRPTLFHHLLTRDLA